MKNTRRAFMHGLTIGVAALALRLKHDAGAELPVPQEPDRRWYLVTLDMDTGEVTNREKITHSMPLVA